MCCYLQRFAEVLELLQQLQLQIVGMFEIVQYIVQSSIFFVSFNIEFVSFLNCNCNKGFKLKFDENNSK